MPSNESTNEKILVWIKNEAVETGYKLGIGLKKRGGGVMYANVRYKKKGGKCEEILSAFKF